MKRTEWIIRVVVSGLTLTTVARLTPPTLAQTPTFTCTTINGEPTILATTQRGSVPILRWVPKEFTGSAQDLQPQCEQVAQKLQLAYKDRTQNSLTIGILNGQLVVCVPEQPENACIGLLFPFQTTTEGVQQLQLQPLLNVSILPSEPLNDSQLPYFSINMNLFLDNLPVGGELDSEPAEMRELFPSEPPSNPSELPPLW